MLAAEYINMRILLEGAKSTKETEELVIKGRAEFHTL
jgi:hypothetical protein